MSDFGSGNFGCITNNTVDKQNILLVIFRQAVFVMLLLFTTLLVGCGEKSNKKSEMKENTSSEQSKQLQGKASILTQPLSNADATIYNLNNDQEIANTVTGADGKFRFELGENKTNNLFKVTVKGGTYNDLQPHNKANKNNNLQKQAKPKTFTAELTAICRIQSSNKCNTNLFTTIAVKNNSNPEKYQSSYQNLLNILGISEDDINKKTDNINKNLLIQLVNAKGFTSVVNIISKDIEDGFIDDINLAKIFKSAKLRSNSNNGSDSQSNNVESSGATNPSQGSSNGSQESEPTETAEGSFKFGFSKEALELQKKVEEVLKDNSVSSTTEEELKQSSWHKSPEEQRALNKLVKSQKRALTAFDPDPGWKTTVVDQEVIFAEPGKSYEVEFYKGSYAGERVGDITDAELRFLRLEVRIQRSENDFEYVPEEYQNRYVEWVDSNGLKKLKIKVPYDLEKGRVIVGLRPKFENEGTQILTERWSRAVTADVTPTKAGVTSISAESVVYPTTSANKIQNSEFTLNEIKTLTKSIMDKNSSILYPIVLKDKTVVKNQLIDYRVKQSLYSGRVVDVIKRKKQTLAFLSPEFISVYDFVDGSPTFLKDQGVLPEFIVFRDGEQIQSQNNETDSDIRYLGPKDKIAIQSLFPPATGKLAKEKLFKFECSQSVENGKSTFAFTPQHTTGRDPRMGIQLTFGFDKWKGKNECKVKTNLKRLAMNVVDTTPLGRALGRIFGTEILIGPEGSLELELDFEAQEVGFNLSAGFNFVPKTKKLYPNFDVGLDFYGADGAGLEANINKISIKPLGELIINAELVVASVKKDSNNMLASVLRFINDDLEGELKAAVKVGGNLAGALESFNAAGAYKGKESGASLGAKFKAEASLTAAIKKIFKFNQFKFSPGFRYDSPRFDIVKFAKLNYNVDKVDNLGGHTARIKMKPSIPIPIFGDRIVDGYTSLQGSSVFNKKISKVDYDPKECVQTKGDLRTPVVACLNGLFCNTSPQKARLCDGRLVVHPVKKSGKAGKKVVDTSSVTYLVPSWMPENTNLNISLFGSPMVPDDVAIDLSVVKGKSHVSKRFSLTGICTSKGKLTGKIRAEVRGTDITQESTNELLCKEKDDDDDDNCRNCCKTCDTIWGDPYLVTGDGFAYDYLASGDYILQQVVDDTNKPIKGLEVQARFLPGYEVSWMHSVAMQVGDDVLEIRPAKLDLGGAYLPGVKLFLNGKVLDLAIPITERQRGHSHDCSFYLERYTSLPSGGSIYVDRCSATRVAKNFIPNTVTISWPEDGPFKGYKLKVSTPSRALQTSDELTNQLSYLDLKFTKPDTHRSKLRGMMGNHDGNPNNEFIRRNGEVINKDELTFENMYRKFGGDWLVKGKECLFTDGCNHSVDFPTALKQLTPKQLAFGLTHCKELKGFYKNACIRDVGITGNPKLITSYYFDDRAKEDTENTSEKVDRKTELNKTADVLVVNQPKKDPAIKIQTQFLRKHIEKYDYKVSVTSLTHQGRYALIVSPPNKANAYLVNNKELTQTYKGDINRGQRVSFDLKVDCDPETITSGLQGTGSRGVVQLWSVDKQTDKLTEQIQTTQFSCAKFGLIDNRYSRLYVYDGNGKVNHNYKIHSGHTDFLVPTKTFIGQQPILFQKIDVYGSQHDNHAKMALDLDGNVWLWGINHFPTVNGAKTLKKADGTLVERGTHYSKDGAFQIPDIPMVQDFISGYDSAMMLYDSGELWYWYGRAGVIKRFVLPSGVIIKELISQNYAVDTDNNVWQLNWRKKNKTPKKFFDSKSLANVKIRKIVTANDDVYILSEDGRTWEQDRDALRFYNPGPKDGITKFVDIYAPDGNVFWIDNNNRLWRKGYPDANLVLPLKDTVVLDVHDGHDTYYVRDAAGNLYDYGGSLHYSGTHEYRGSNVNVLPSNKEFEIYLHNIDKVEVNAHFSRPDHLLMSNRNRYYSEVGKVKGNIKIPLFKDSLTLKGNKLTVPTGFKIKPSHRRDSSTSLEFFRSGKLDIDVYHFCSGVEGGVMQKEFYVKDDLGNYVVSPTQVSYICGSADFTKLSVGKDNKVTLNLKLKSDTKKNHIVSFKMIDSGGQILETLNGPTNLEGRLYSQHFKFESIDCSKDYPINETYKLELSMLGGTFYKHVNPYILCQGDIVLGNNYLIRDAFGRLWQRDTDKANKGDVITQFFPQLDPDKIAVLDATSREGENYFSFIDANTNEIYSGYKEEEIPHRPYKGYDLENYNNHLKKAGLEIPLDVVAQNKDYIAKGIISGKVDKSAIGNHQLIGIYTHDFRLAYGVNSAALDVKGNILQWGTTDCNLRNDYGINTSAKPSAADVSMITATGAKVVEIQPRYHGLLAKDSKGKMWIKGAIPRGKGTTCYKFNQQYNTTITTPKFIPMELDDIYATGSTVVDSRLVGNRSAGLYLLVIDSNKKLWSCTRFYGVAKKAECREAYIYRDGKEFNNEGFVGFSDSKNSELPIAPDGDQYLITDKNEYVWFTIHDNSVHVGYIEHSNSDKLLFPKDAILNFYSKASKLSPWRISTR